MSLSSAQKTKTDGRPAPGLRVPPLLHHAVAPLVLLLLSCIGDYNPFSDAHNAGVHFVKQTVADGDTVRLFSAETLSAVVLVKELVDEVTVACRANRFWPGGDTTVSSDRFQDEPFHFFISLYDTGVQRIVIAARLTGGETRAETLNVRAESPLYQPPVTGHFSRPVALRTPPVADPGVFYFWSFGAGTVVFSPACTTTAAINTAGPSGEGRLWVSDGVRSSPARPFVFTLNDTVPPGIACVNGGYGGGDTVYTADSVFTFAVRITDRSDLPVDSASLNGAAFDRSSDGTYYAAVSGAHAYTAAAPLVLDVYALDRFVFGNDTTRRFYLVFTDTAASQPAVALSITVPADDSVVIGAGRLTTAGTVRNLTADSLDVMLSVTMGSATALTAVRLGSAPWHWQRELTLSPGENALATALLSVPGNDTLVQADRRIVFVPGATDTTPPVVIDFLADGVPADNYYTKNGSAVLTIRAVDAGSAVTTVTVNEDTVRADAAAYTWRDTIPLDHTTAGNEVRLAVADSAGNTASVTALIYRNRKPVAVRVPSPAYVCADSAWADTAEAVDPDGDPLMFTKHSGPAGLTVSENGAVAWTPLARDTGTHTVRLRVWDGFQPVYITFLLTVIDRPGSRGPVRFATTVEQFPRFLTAGSDTLRVQLAVDAAAGTPPFIFAARLVAPAAVILAPSGSGLLAWAPAASDTGYRQLVVTVSDAFADGDTLYPAVTVLPPNAPCSLRVRYASPQRPDGVVDLNALRATDTLCFTIVDSDNRLYEKHAISIWQARSKATSVIDSATADTFLLVIDPRTIDGSDTVVAVVRDKGGHVDSARLALYYGTPPATPALLSPANNATVAADSVTLQWSGSDPDADPLSYYVYTGGDPAALTLAAHVTGASHVLRGLSAPASYYWMIVARDWKSQTASVTRRFSRP